MRNGRPKFSKMNLNQINLKKKIRKLIPQSSHTFHIPVMGTGFTIDAPLRIAKYGISSVISLVEDTLIEQMRKFHCEKAGLPYEEITARKNNARALRITAYLDLMDCLIKSQVEELQASPFEKGSQITRYFELLPACPLKKTYQNMLLAKPRRADIASANSGGSFSPLRYKSLLSFVMILTSILPGTA